MHVYTVICDTGYETPLDCAKFSVGMLSKPECWLCRCASQCDLNLVRVAGQSCSQSLIRVQSRGFILVYCSSRDSGILTLIPNRLSYEQVGLLRYIEVA